MFMDYVPCIQLYDRFLRLRRSPENHKVASVYMCERVRTPILYFIFPKHAHAFVCCLNTRTHRQARAYARTHSHTHVRARISILTLLFTYMYLFKIKT